jgi:hypothetical protein
MMDYYAPGSVHPAAMSLSTQTLAHDHPQTRPMPLPSLMPTSSPSSILSHFNEKRHDQQLHERQRQEQELPLSTFSQQSSLPHLPLPSLSDTAERYLDSIEPFLADMPDGSNVKEEVERRFRLFMRDAGGPGAKAQARLMELVKRVSWVLIDAYEGY